ncbi:MAG: hypothetical protein ABR964_05860 [Tepidisphaeraceae bacterium]|jgi:hypothetical protein
MTIQEIQRLKEEKPFKPFRVLTADGRAYDVLHPECLAQSPSGRLIVIGLPDDSMVTLDLLLVAGIRRGIKAGRNGSKRKRRS